MATRSVAIIVFLAVFFTRQSWRLASQQEKRAPEGARLVL